MTNLLNRVLVAIVGLPVVLGAVWAGGWWLFALVAIAGAVAVHEFVLMARPLAPLAPAPTSACCWRCSARSVAASSGCSAAS